MAGLAYHIHHCKEEKKRNSNLTIWHLVPGKAVPRQWFADLYDNWLYSKKGVVGWW